MHYVYIITWDVQAINSPCVNSIYIWILAINLSLKYEQMKKSDFVSIKEYWPGMEIMMTQLQIIIQNTDCV